jgi:hypothetical protein
MIAVSAICVAMLPMKGADSLPLSPVQRECPELTGSWWFWFSVPGQPVATMASEF